MSVIRKLATSLGSRDEQPNIALANELARTKNKKHINEIVKHLSSEDRNIQSDCIKTLYELGYLEPQLIADYVMDFVAALDSKNNRIVWGAMIALSTITSVVPHDIFSSLPKIIDTADKGSVITNDACVEILVELGAISKYHSDVFDLLIERIRRAPVNQLPTYAEKTLALVNAHNKTTFIAILNRRLKDLEQASKKNRVEKVISKAMMIK